MILQSAGRPGGRDADSEGRKIFLGGLPFEAAEDDLRHDFEKFGRIEDVHLPRDKETDRPRGFAFITYSEALDAQDAAKDMHACALRSRLLLCLAAGTGRGGG